MLHIVLYQPEIPPNTGNVMRLAANTGARLTLIEPLGFDLSERKLRRAGLDYREWAEVDVRPTLADFDSAHAFPRTWAFTTKGQRSYADVTYADGDALLFGPESRGLPTGVLQSFAPEQRLRIPMVPGSRSINLSNAVAVVLFEAWRQLGFDDAT